MKLLRFALRHGFTVALVVGAPAVAVAQAALAPPNPQQERCIEAFAETQQEKAIREAIGEPPKKALDEAFNQDKADSLFVWATKRAIAVFGSEEAAYAANEKMRIEKYTRRFELLRKNAKEGHLPSLQLLASHYWGKKVQDIPGLPTPEERSAAYRTLHDHRFPLAAGALAAECREAVRGMSESSATKEQPPELVDGQIQKFGTEIEIVEDDADVDAYEKVRQAREAQEARRLAEIATKREACVNLWREAGFRGEMYAWETLADHYTTYYRNYSTYHKEKAPPPQPGVVPSVELYAWLELDKLRRREDGSEDQYNVPRMHQDDLVKDVLDEEQRRDARALAEKYAQIIWPRRIKGDVCRLIPQFAGDAEPYGADPSPH